MSSWSISAGRRRQGDQAFGRSVAARGRVPGVRIRGDPEHVADGGGFAPEGGEVRLVVGDQLRRVVAAFDEGGVVVVGLVELEAAALPELREGRAVLLVPDRGLEGILLLGCGGGGPDVREQPTDGTRFGTV